MNITLLSSIVDVDGFLADMARDLIQERKHPEDSDLRIYSYTKKAQYGGLWTPAAKLARGLILRVPGGDFSKAVVVSRGLPKFFTLEQIDSDWGRVKLVDDDENVVVSEAPVIPWDAPAVVAEKMNGALGLGYVDSTGKFRISTKGSFESLESTVANRVLDGKYSAVLDELAVDTGYTMLFEIITPERPHPVDYGDLEDLIFLGSVSNATGAWFPSEENSKMAELGFPVAPRKSVATLREAVALPYAANTEGFVVTVVDGGPEAIYKIKPKEYLDLRRLFYAVQEGELVKLALTESFAESAFSAKGPDDIDLSSLVGSLAISAQTERLLAAAKGKLYFEVALPARQLVFEAVGRIRAVLPGLKKSSSSDRELRAALANFVKGSVPKELQGLHFAAMKYVLGGGLEVAMKLGISIVVAEL